MMLLGIASIVACNPIEDREEMTDVLTADQLNISVVPEVRDGVNSNYIHVSSDGNPILASWDYGTGTFVGSSGVVQVLLTGDVDIKFIGRNGDGTMISKVVTVKVEKLYDVPIQWGLFCGAGSKTWVFDAFTDKNHPYGIGSAGNDKSATWWGPEYGDFTEWDAKITFSLDGGAIFIKTLSNGTVQKGSFSFDLTKTVGNWSQGVLTLRGATIPHAVSVNNGNGEAYEFYILELTEDQLILGNVSGNGVSSNPDGEANFWVFRPEGWRP